MHNNIQQPNNQSDVDEDYDVIVLGGSYMTRKEHNLIWNDFYDMDFEFHGESNFL